MVSIIEDTMEYICSLFEGKGCEEMVKILVVEDEVQIRELIVEFLVSQHYEVHESKDGIEAYQLFQQNDFDLVIMDVMMPHLDGYGLCQLIRMHEFYVPIMFLTALSDEEDEIKAFELKADDYLSKPFSFNVLIRRVEALLRRSKLRKLDGESDVIKFNKLRLHVKSYKCYVDEQEIELTLKEFNILKLLINHYPHVVSREMLLDKIWGFEYCGDTRIIDTHMKNIRKKINYPYLKTVKGVGYVFESDLE